MATEKKRNISLEHAVDEVIGSVESAHEGMTDEEKQKCVRELRKFTQKIRDKHEKPRERARTAACPPSA
jgi:hypothetical protein